MSMDSVNNIENRREDIMDGDIVEKERTSKSEDTVCRNRLEDQEKQENEQNDVTKMNLEERLDVDKGYAWAVVSASFALQFLLSGYIKSNGTVFVEFQNQFGSTSSMTSLIMGIQEASCSISSFIFLGFILKRTSPRFLCLIGTACLILGSSGNFLAARVEFLIFTHGICFGISMGTVYGSSLIVLSHYFEKRRALATSLVMTGSSVGGTTIPYLTRHLVVNYGFHGGFLLLGGVLSHCLLFSMFLFPVRNNKITQSQPSTLSLEIVTDTTIPNSDGKTESCKIFSGWENIEMQRSIPSLNCKESNLDVGHVSHLNGGDIIQGSRIIVSHEPEQRHERYKQQTKSRSSHSKSSDTIENSMEQQYQTASPSRDSPTRDNIIVHTVVLEEERSNCSTWLRPNYRQNVSPLANGDHTDGSTSLLDKSNVIPCRPKTHRVPDFFQSTSTLHSIADIANTASQSNKPKSIQTSQGDTSCCVNACSKLRSNVHNSTIIRTFTFWALALFFVFSSVGCVLQNTYIPALAKERGLTDNDGAFFLSILNILDIQARLFPGFIVNAGYLKASTMCVVPLTALGIVGYFVQFMNSYETLLGLVITYGLFSGIFISMQTLVVIEMVGLKRYPFVLAFSYLIMSIGATVLYPIAGLMKDRTGSYNMPYHCLATMELVSVVILLCLPAIKRVDVRRGVLEQNPT